MRLPPRFVRKSVKNAERRRSKPQPEPGSRGRLLLNKRETSTKKIFHVLLFSGFYLQAYPQSYFDCVSHVISPFLFNVRLCTLILSGSAASLLLRFLRGNVLTFGAWNLLQLFQHLR